MGVCVSTQLFTHRQTRKHDLYDFSISDVLLVSERDEGVVGRVSEQQELLGQDSVRMFRKLGEWEWDRQLGLHGYTNNQILCLDGQ